MARFLLDTQAFIVLATKGPKELSKSTRALIDDPDNDRLFSSVSVTEIAVKSSIGKLAFTTAMISQAAVDLRLMMIPYTLAHAERLFNLPLHHREPFDRMLIATAMAEAVPIVSTDGMFKKYKGLKTIW